DQVVLPGLIEIDYGQWEGLSPEQARASDPARYDAWIADPVSTGPPRGETAAQVAERALKALQQIASGPGPALPASPHATIRLLGGALSGAPIAHYRTRWSQAECALNLIELRPGKDPFLRLWNDTSHLGPDPAATTRGGK